MNYTFIQTQRYNQVFSISLNRPEKHNALSIDLVQELHHCFTELLSDTDVHAVFIHGNEKAFSAGGDLKEMKDLDKEEANKRSQYVQETFQLMAQIKVPVVSFIQGICFGGGLELALHSDFRICSDTAKLALPEVKYGMIPGAGGTVQLALQMNNADAAFHLLTGSEIDLNKAYYAGVIQSLVADSAFNQEIDKQQTYFNSASKEALKAVKAMIISNKSHKMELYKQESDLFSTLLSEQGNSGIEKKFINKSTR